MSTWWLGAVAALTTAPLTMGADCGYRPYPYRGFTDAGHGFVPTDAAPRAHDAGLAVDAELRRDTGGWEIHAIDGDPSSPSGVGYAPELAIASDGTFHVVHLDQTHGAVRYARGTPGAFTVEVVATEEVGTLGVSPASLALDARGDVQLAYAHDQALGAVSASRVADSWERTILPFDDGLDAVAEPLVRTFASGPPLFVGVGPADAGQRDVLAVIGRGAPSSIGRIRDAETSHLVALTGADGAAWVAFTSPIGGFDVATLSAGTWSSVHVLEGEPMALALDVNGNARVAFVRTGVGGQFELTTRAAPFDDASADAESTMTSSYAAIRRVSFAIGASGAVHVAIDAGGALTYLTSTTGLWGSMHIADVGEANGRPAIALDADERPWIAYRAADGVLVVATPATH
jgi:hypothetical protein